LTSAGRATCSIVVRAICRVAEGDRVVIIVLRPGGVVDIVAKGVGREVKISGEKRREMDLGGNGSTEVVADQVSAVQRDYYRVVEQRESKLTEKART